MLDWTSICYSIGESCERINRDFSVTLVSDETGDYSCCFANAGILVFSKGEKNIIIDMFSSKAYRSSDGGFFYEALERTIVPSVFGMSLPDRMLVKAMKTDAGAHFVAREEHMSRWRQEEFSREQFELENLN